MTQFPAPTGTSKAIEDVRTGDKVLATDPKTGRTQAKPVLATITSKGKKNLVQITIDTTGPRPSWTTGTQLRSGAELRATGSEGALIIATDAHPFWVAGDINGWVDATDLEPGMWLRNSDNSYVQVTDIKRWMTHNQRVYNLTIADIHTYYVEFGAIPVLVHNDMDDCSDAAFQAVLHNADEINDGNLNHLVPGMDSRTPEGADRLADYVEEFYSTPGTPLLNGTGEAWYDRARGIYVYRGTGAHPSGSVFQAPPGYFTSKTGVSLEK